MSRPKGSLNKIKETPAIRFLYKHFVTPFLAQYELRPNSLTHDEGIEGFFGFPGRRVAWCRAKQDFTIVGPMWLTTSRPTYLINGTGRRKVKKGDELVLRVDKRMPERSELEFDEQVFVLTQVQLQHINEKLEVVA